VAQTKLVLQLLREMRIERKEARIWAAGGDATAGSDGDAAYEASIAKYMSAYTETLAALENAGPLTPAAAARAREALSRAVSPALFAASGEGSPASVPVTGSRAQRRAMMKRNGAFKRNG
jgi:hypothetical protein